MNPLTQTILGTVGSPFASSDYRSDIESLTESYRYAALNRIPFLFLCSLKKRRELAILQNEYDLLSRRYNHIQGAFFKITEVLDRSHIRYAFFKSLRPYEEVTVDIDVLLFDSAIGAAQVMHKAGYELLGAGPLSTTFRDPEANINIDLYEEIGVSHIIYMDKEKLKERVENRPTPQGLVFHSLSPEADLLSVIAHSVIKEQMYVLSEYFTTLHYLTRMNNESISIFLSLVDECKLHSVAKVHLGITALLHSNFYDKLPKSLASLVRSLGQSGLESALVADSGFKMPHKYHPTTVIRGLIEKFGEGKARRSFGKQLLIMLNPDSGLSIMGNVLSHVQRQTY